MVPLISLSRMLLLRRRRRRRLRRLLAHTPLNTLLDSCAKKITLSLFDKAFFVFFFSSSSLLAAGSSFFLSTTRFGVREREESPTHLRISLSFVCVYSTTNDFYTTKREGEEETKRDPPPKKTPGAPNLGFYKFFLGFYFVCVFWVVERT